MNNSNLLICNHEYYMFDIVSYMSSILVFLRKNNIKHINVIAAWIPFGINNNGYRYLDNIYKLWGNNNDIDLNIIYVNKDNNISEQIINLLETNNTVIIFLTINMFLNTKIFKILYDINNFVNIYYFNIQKSNNFFKLFNISYIKSNENYKKMSEENLKIKSFINVYLPNYKNEKNFNITQLIKLYNLKNNNFLKRICSNSSEFFRKNNYLKL